MPRSGPRSPLSIGLDWSSRITTIGLEFALPALVGHLIDRRLGTKPVFLLVGAVAGFAVGMMHLVRIAGQGSKAD